MPRALLIEHDAYTRPGHVGAALTRRGFEIERRLVVPADRFHAPDVNHDFPDPHQWDLIVPMGAPWSVTDTARIGSWLQPELRMLEKAHRGGVPVLGICFGGQAMSAALGGRVLAATGWEIGPCVVRSTRPDLVGEGPWWQFHQDSMTVPPGATMLAENDHAVQAWTAERTLAVQFHPELTAEVLSLWLDNGAAAIAAAQGVDGEKLLRDSRADDAAAAARADELVGTFLDRIASA